MKQRFFVLLAGVLLTFSTAFAKDVSINSNTLNGIFSIAEDFCQYKIANGSKTEIQLFSKLLNEIRTQQAVHISIDFVTHQVYFIEPQSEIHIMPALYSVKVKDSNLCNDLEIITCEIENEIFPDNVKKSMHLRVELQVSLESLTTQLSPRNRVSLEYKTEFIDASNKTRTLEYNGPATIIY